ncbi:MAG: sialate O-acetylesterase [Odoribacter sp.]|nr:sialate O-acetylesterase [Odoribacter sp.]
MRRIILWGMVMYLWMQIGCAQKYTTFYYQRATLFEELPVTSKDIIFLGNSITNGGEWGELFGNKHVKNRGISGDICMGVYDRLQPILKGKPAKIFLLIGINDLSRGTSADTIVSQIARITRKIKGDSPKTKLYLQSILPVSDHYKMFGNHTKHWQVVGEINEKLRDLAKRECMVYIDLYSRFVDPVTGKMKTEYSNDGLHLLGKGYKLWVEIVRPYVLKK